MIISPDPQSDPDHIVAVAVTSTFTLPLTDNIVSLPWEGDGNCGSGLRRECVAVCDWVVVFQASAVQNECGTCSTRVLSEILAHVIPPRPTE